jgi:hypothetical protein
LNDSEDSLVGQKFYLGGILRIIRASNPDFANVNSELRLTRQKNVFTNIFVTCKTSEVLIFSGALKNDERQSVESYLIKKWVIKTKIKQQIDAPLCLKWRKLLPAFLAKKLGIHS